MQVEQRFWDKVGDHSDPNACWLWHAGTIKSGKLRYGQININNRCVLAHRFAYELLIGPIPKGMTLDHVKARGCSSTLCVNPAHLEVVTLKSNILRGEGPWAINARKTHCKRGHQFTKENTYRRPDGTRYCIACGRERSR